MRKKLGVTLFAAAALLGAPAVLTAPPASASTCASQVPVVCDVYTGVARTLCQAVAKYADCIQ
jgi:hypothetical protein